jgi:hypothetical protein
VRCTLLDADPGHGGRVAEVYLPKTLPRARLFDRGSERTEDLIDAKEIGMRAQVIEVDNVCVEPGSVGTVQDIWGKRPAGEHHDSLERRIRQQQTQALMPDKTGGTT